MSYSRRSGFTLVELLVVIAIIAVLIGLLVPAVQKVREAALRTQCQNNLKQMGIAMHAYYNVKEAFPPAYQAATTGVLPGWGWGTFILPYVEQQPLFESLNTATASFGGGTNPAPSNSLTQMPLSVYRCPADNGAATNTQRLNHATSNYRAVAGTASAYPAAFSENQDFGGVMFQNSAITMYGITDGTSNTVLVGECQYSLPAPGNSTPYWGAIWAGMTGLNTDGARVSDVMWWVDQANSTINGSNPQAFNSNHIGGAYFLFCDGSVRFWYQTADITTLRYMAGRADGFVVDVPN